jgi:hypothetical protein
VCSAAHLTASADAQREALKRWSLRTKTGIAKWFVDAGDAPLEDREALMLAISSLGKVTPILCVAGGDVLGNEAGVRSVVEHLVERSGATLVDVTLQPTQPAERNAELDRILRAHALILVRLQVLASDELRKPRGAFWGRCPWGFRISGDGMRLEPYPPEQALKAVVKHMRARGLKLREIAEELNKLGVVTRTGGPIGITRVYELLNEGQGSRVGGHGDAQRGAGTGASSANGTVAGQASPLRGSRR